MKRGEHGPLMKILVSLVGILVSLAVGFGMIDGVLTVRYIPMIVTIVAGWIVVAGIVLGLLIAIVKALAK